MSNFREMFFSAPFASAFTTKYGVRAVGIFGSLMTSTAFIVSMLSPNVEMLIITLGIFGGTITLFSAKTVVRTLQNVFF